MQNLHIVNAKGGLDDIKVARAFINKVSEAYVVEYADGSWGYTNGEPIKAEEEIAFLPTPHRERVLTWLNGRNAPVAKTEKDSVESLFKMDKPSLAALAGLDENEAKKVKKDDLIQIILGDKNAEG